MKPEDKKHEKTAEQSNLKIKLLVIGITIAKILALAGCQEADIVHKTPLLNDSLCTENMYTLSVYPSNREFYENEANQTNGTKGVYLVGTKTYAEKLMSLYENSDIPKLNSGQGRTNDTGVPLLLITF